METTLLHKNEGVFLAHEKQRPKGRNLVPWALLLLSHLLERYHLALTLLRRVGRLWGVGSGDRFHEAADLLCRTSLHIVGDVRVGVQSEPSAVMAQHAGQGLHIHAAGDRHGLECVPLLYNNDKRKKPLFSRGLSVCRHLFNSFSKLKYDEKIIE